MTTILLVIMGVLLAAAAVLFVVYYGGDAFGSGKTEAEAGRLVSEGAQMEAALELFYRQEGHYPTSDDPVAEMMTAGYLSHEPLGTRTSEPDRWAIDYNAGMIKAKLGLTDEEETMNICLKARQQLELPDTGTELGVYKCDGSDSPGGILPGREPCCIGETELSDNGGSVTPIYEVFSQTAPIGNPDCSPSAQWAILKGTGPGMRTGHCAGDDSSRDAMWEHSVTVPAAYQDSINAGVGRASISVEMNGYNGDTDRGRPYISCKDSGGATLMFTPLSTFTDPDGWPAVTVSDVLPAGCATVQYGTMSTRLSGTENSIYYRNFQMTLAGGDGSKKVYSLYRIGGYGFKTWTPEVGPALINGSTYRFNFPSITPPENTDYARYARMLQIPSEHHASIDAGKASLRLNALVWNWDNQSDEGRFNTIYLDANGNTLSNGPQSTAASHAPSEYGTFYDNTAAIPAGTRSVKLVLHMTRRTRGFTNFNASHYGIELHVNQ